MVLALSAEAAGILGALAGGGIAIAGQALFIAAGAVRARRVAAQVIYAELIGNLANAVPAIGGSGWSSSKPEALRAAWETYGARLLLPWHKAHDVGSIASAYNRVDDIAWLATENFIDPNQDYTAHILDIQVGLYVVGRAAGYSDIELAARQIPVTAVRGMLEEGQGRATASRKAHRRQRWSALRRLVPRRR